MPGVTLPLNTGFSNPMSSEADTKSPRAVPSGLFSVHGSRMVILDPDLTHGSSISFLIDFLNQRPVRRVRSNEPVNALPVSFPELVLGNIQGRPYDCKRVVGVRRVVRFVSPRFIDFLIQFILEVSLRSHQRLQNQQRSRQRSMFDSGCLLGQRFYRIVYPTPKLRTHNQLVVLPKGPNPPSLNGSEEIRGGGRRREAVD